MSEPYKYQPDSPHVASSIQTHDDPYRNTRTPPPTGDRDDLASILAKHRHKPIHETETFRGVRESYQIGVGCRCGWGAEGGYQEDDHRAHVAQMVLESDWLRDVKADVWDKGHEGCDCGVCMHGLIDDTVCDYCTNPYRADRVDAEDGGR